jgi:hypothetical protein
MKNGIAMSGKLFMDENIAWEIKSRPIAPPEKPYIHKAIPIETPIGTDKNTNKAKEANSKNISINLTS